MLSNTTAIAEAWARLDHKFDLMFMVKGVKEMNYRNMFDLTGTYQLAFLIGVVFNIGNLVIIISLLLRTHKLNVTLAR